ncbi:MAG: hypothetical protein ABSH22_16945 [Tepidisphaeraceae bacterium]|jgi:hypothetical protein
MALALLAGPSVVLRADPPAAPPIPDAVKQAPSLDQNQVQQIQDAVAAVVKNLGDSADPAIQDADRDWLVAATTDGSKAPGSAEYLKAYAKAVNNQMVPLVTTPATSFRTKIEAGVAAAKIGQIAQNTELVPLTTALLRDGSPAVVLEGMKAAGAVLTPVLYKHKLDRTDGDLLDAMLAAVGNNAAPPLGGAIVDEAYDALQQPVLGLNRPAGVLNVSVLVPLVMQMEKQRLPLYADDIPQSPQADSKGVVILFTHDIWLGVNGAGGLNPKQQIEALEMTASLIDASGKAAHLPAFANRGPMNDLIDALRTDGRELQNFSNPNNGVSPDATLDTAAGRLGGLAPSSSLQTIDGATADTVAALRALEK